MAKRGRPKGSKNKPAKTKAVVKSKPEASAATAQDAVADILAQAAVKSELQVGDPYLSNISEEDLAKRLADAKPQTDAVLDSGQADFLPGTYGGDPTFVPEFVYDEIANRERRATMPDEYHYYWVSQERMTHHKLKGYRYVEYSGGKGSAAGGFTGTGLYDRTLDNHVRNGDVFLMYTSMRNWEAIRRANREHNSAIEGAVQDGVHNEGYRRGVRTFTEKDGTIVYN